MSGQTAILERVFSGPLDFSLLIKGDSYTHFLKKKYLLSYFYDFGLEVKSHPDPESLLSDSVFTM